MRGGHNKIGSIFNFIDLGLPGMVDKDAISVLTHNLLVCRMSGFGKGCPKLLEGLKKLSKYDPVVISPTEESGEHVVADPVEWPVETCLKTLRDEYALNDFVIGGMVVPYRELLLLSRCLIVSMHVQACVLVFVFVPIRRPAPQKPLSVKQLLGLHRPHAQHVRSRRAMSCPSLPAKRAGTCTTCNQSYPDMEKDLLPEKEEVLKWVNLTRKGPRQPSGYECYFCFSTRRKCFGLSQEELDSAISESTQVATVHAEKTTRSRQRRRSLCEVPQNRCQGTCREQKENVQRSLRRGHLSKSS